MFSRLYRDQNDTCTQKPHRKVVVQELSICIQNHTKYKLRNCFRKTATDCYVNKEKLFQRYFSKYLTYSGIPFLQVNPRKK